MKTIFFLILLLVASISCTQNLTAPKTESDFYSSFCKTYHGLTIWLYDSENHSHSFCSSDSSFLTINKDYTYRIVIAGESKKISQKIKFEATGIYQISALKRNSTSWSGHISFQQDDGQYWFGDFSYPDYATQNVICSFSQITSPNVKVGQDYSIRIFKFINNYVDYLCCEDW